MIIQSEPEEENIDDIPKNEGDSKPQKKDAYPYFNEIMDALRVLENEYADELEWNTINVNAGIKSKELIFSVMPKPNPRWGKGSSWAYIDKKNQRKVLWAMIKKSNKYTYLVELDCTPKEHFGIYLLNYGGGYAVSNDELVKVMERWASNKDYCKPSGLGVNWKRRFIPHKAQNPTKLAKAIWEKT